MAVVGKLTASLTANTSRFNRKMSGAGRMVKAFGSKVKAVTGAIVKMGAVAAVAAIAGVTVLMNKMTQAGDRIAKTAKALGMSAEDISALGFAAGRSGAELELMSKSLANFARIAAYAKDGLLTYVREFDKLGISVTDQHGDLKDLKALFLETAEALSTMQNKTERLAIAKALFGRGGKELMPMLIEGREGIEALMATAEKLGGVWTSVQARGAEKFRDSLLDLKTAAGGLARDLLMKLVPGLTRLTDRLAEALAPAGKIRDGIMEIAPAIEDFVDKGIQKFKEFVADDSLERWLEQMQTGFVSLLAILEATAATAMTYVKGIQAAYKLGDLLERDYKLRVARGKEKGWKALIEEEKRTGKPIPMRYVGRYYGALTETRKAEESARVAGLPFERLSFMEQQLRSASTAVEYFSQDLGDIWATFEGVGDAAARITSTFDTLNERLEAMRRPGIPAVPGLPTPTLAPYGAGAGAPAAQAAARYRGFMDMPRAQDETKKNTAETAKELKLARRIHERNLEALERLADEQMEPVVVTF